MKTTLDLPDPILRQAKARAALKGLSMKSFITQAIEEKLSADSRSARKPQGWRTVFGKAPKGAAAEVDAVIAAEFEGINMDDWQ